MTKHASFYLLFVPKKVLFLTCCMLTYSQNACAKIKRQRKKGKPQGEEHNHCILYVYYGVGHAVVKRRKQKSILGLTYLSSLALQDNIPSKELLLQLLKNTIHSENNRWKGTMSVLTSWNNTHTHTYTCIRLKFNSLWRAKKWSSLVVYQLSSSLSHF